ncbi:MAG TPA: DUF5752 family protein [Acidiferrobacterales bacterium]|nr:DUF5752 family protein [Acidiferrobacterales bacterium]
MTEQQDVSVFVIKDCALAAIATGLRAQNLRELRDHLTGIHLGCIYYHFWGGLLRPHFDDPEYNNDFASWARHALHDVPLAERLGVIDPADYPELEGLRQELIETIEERIEETEYQTWSRPDQQFYFVRAQTVSLDTGRRLTQPAELATIVPQLSLGSVFYHFIDARRREPQGVDDFRAWLAQFGDVHDGLRVRLAEVDPYFINLAELRAQLTRLFRDYFGGPA